MRVIAYTRVSTEEQATQGVSLSAQEAKLRAYCDLYGHELLEVIVDAGQSAKTLKRPGLQRALEALKAGEADGLLVLKLDRLTRSVRDLGDLLETYFQTSALLSLQEQCDTSTAAGRLVLNLLTSVAQWERETTSERTKTSLAFKKTQGVVLGRPPLADRETIDRVLELHAAGYSLRKTVEVLVAEGRQTQRGGAWAPNTVRKILAREGR